MSLSFAARSSAQGSAREEDARRGLRCAPLPASTSFQKKPSAFSGVSCCPPYQQSHSKDFPGTSFSLPFLFQRLPLYSQALYKISGTGEIKKEKRKRKKRSLTASLHSPPQPPSSQFLSLRPGGPRNPQRAGAKPSRDTRFSTLCAGASRGCAHAQAHESEL